MRHLGAARVRQVLLARAVARFAVALLPLGIAWASLAELSPARAYRVDAQTQSVRIRSLRDFVKCQKAFGSAGTDSCLDALKAYVKRKPKHAFAAGKLARVHFMHWVALDFFAQALGTRPSKRQCADADLKAAVASGLSLPPHYPAVEQARQLAQGRCWKALKPALLSDLRGPHGSYRDNVCPLLSDKRVPSRHCQRLSEQRRDQADRSLETLATLDASALPLDPESADALRSARGEELLMARTKMGRVEYVLLKFKAVPGPWNERVLIALEQKRAGGKDYVIAERGLPRVVLSERYGHYEAYPEGVAEGLWLTPWRATTEPVHLPTRSQIASEFAAVAP